jgi:threonyl-tRNA synthetase
MIVIGGQEAENKMVAVRNRKEGDLGTMTLADAVAKIEEEIRTKAR